MADEVTEKTGDKKQLLSRPILAGVCFVVVVVLLIIFIVWLILQPTKPKFILQDVTLSSLNLSGPNVLTSTMQATVSSYNPNYRIGMYYEKLDIYASYRNQQITPSSMIPRSYQGHKETTVWSPFLNGEAVPVSPDLAISLIQDQNTELVVLNIKIQGTVKFKVGSWVSGKYRLNVNCPAYISYGERNKGVVIGDAVNYQFLQDCHVEV